MNPTVLASAIDHPCKVVAIAAAEMILAGTGGETASEALKDVLRYGRSFSLYILAQIGNELWGTATLDLFLSRLDQKATRGCEHLLAKLPDLSGGRLDERALSIIQRSLTSEFPIIAQKAAELCFEYAPTDSIVPCLRAALGHWKEHEEPYPNGIGSIPESPRSIIVKALAQWQGLTVDELFDLYSDVRGDVRGEAEDALLRIAQDNPRVLSLLLDWIQTGKMRSATLGKITKLPPETIKHERDRLLAFLTSENPDLRMIMVHTLHQMDLGGKSDCLDLIRERLNDPNEDVRDTARRVLATQYKSAIK